MNVPYHKVYWNTQAKSGRYSTCQQRSTLSIMRYYSDDYISHTVSMSLCFIDLNPNSAVDDNRFVATLNHPLIKWSLVVFIKDRSLDQ